MGMNTKAITNIQRQAVVLSDGHQAVVDQAVEATEAIIRLDERLAGRPRVGVNMSARAVNTHLDGLKGLLRDQAARALRVCAEIEQIQSTLKVE